MPTLTVTKNWDDGTTLTESQLDDIKTSLETFMNTTKLDSDNIQAGGIATANLADNCVTAAKIATAVAGAGLTGGAGTALAVQVDSSTIEINSDTLRVKDSGITTAKINDAAVTQAKRAALGQQVSSSSGSYSTTSATLQAVSNLSISITTTGRAVFIGLIPADNSTDNYLGIQHGSDGTYYGVYAIYRGGSAVSRTNVGGTHPAGTQRFAPGAVWFIEAPAAGTYTYELYSAVSSTVGSPTLHTIGAKLIAYEL